MKINEPLYTITGHQILHYAHAELSKSDRHYTVISYEPCHRCAGEGVVRPWGICFRCGGHSPRTFERISQKAYTAVQYQPAAEAKAKRDARKVEKEIAKLAARAAELDEIRTAFVARKTPGCRKP